MRTPYSGEAIEHGQLGIGIIRYIQHRKIIAQECCSKTGKCKQRKDQLPGHGRTRGSHPVIQLPVRSSQTEKRLNQRQRKGEDQCKVSEFYAHDGMVCQSEFSGGRKTISIVYRGL